MIKNISTIFFRNNNNNKVIIGSKNISKVCLFDNMRITYKNGKVKIDNPKEYKKIIIKIKDNSIKNWLLENSVNDIIFKENNGKILEIKNIKNEYFLQWAFSKSHAVLIMEKV